ncbi:MAG: baseplate J/gp47 family protein [Syntrophomonadaceae bacterium]|jgi:hypothetical protein
MLPPLDPRDTRELTEQLKAMLPFYTPEWRFSPEDPDAGTALFLIFTRMFAGTIKRFNQVPQRNLAAFLNMMNISLLPACSAFAYLTFSLSSIDGESVLIPKGTQAVANSSEGEEVVFETTNNLLVTSATPVAIYTSSGKHDRIAEIPAEALVNNPNYPNQEVALLDCFAGDNLQEHCFFLGEPDLLNIKSKALLEVEIKNNRRQYKEKIDCELLANPSNTEWLYQIGDNWQAFSGVSVSSNRIILKKEQSGQIDYSEINGVKNRWLCCRVKPGRIKVLRDVEFDEIRMRAASLVEDAETGLVPDALFYNDIPLDPVDCYPFGEFFSLYDTFYLASQEVFSKKRAMITISFKLKHEPHIMSNDNTHEIEWKMIMKKSDLEEPERPNLLILRVVWEYWSGSGWAKLFNGSQYEDVFLHVAERPITIKFQCPDDMKTYIINDQMNYWIRARVLSIQNMYAPNGVYHTPKLTGFKISYEYSNDSLEPDSCLSLNNLEYYDYSKELTGKDVIAHPLVDLSLSYPATYLGFEQPPTRGPISLFLSLREQRYDPNDAPGLKWEYTRQNQGESEWSRLDVFDQTNNLSSSGLLVFGGPSDFTRKLVFGKKLYWVRVVNYDSKFDRSNNRLPPPVAKGLFMNTTKVIQQESAYSETLNNASGEANFSYSLPRIPVVREEVWVEESALLSESEKEELLHNKEFDLRDERDQWGNTTKLWIKWKRVEDLGLSESGDRHYTIDTSTGEVRFGDNQHGKIPPRSDIKNIEIKYWIGGGSKGNVGPREINRLRNPLPFIDKVFNPEAACGGCDKESFKEALSRGPYSLKHHGRAVTIEDFETMAREVSRNVARVKCLSNTNGRGEKESGCITLVILPRGGRKASLTFPALKQDVERYIYQRTSGNLLFPGKLEVIEPLYLEIGITALLVIDSIDDMVVVETEARKKIKQFLQPELYDNYNNQGWDIGEYPHISILYTLLKTINGVNYVENVSMTVHKLVNEERIEIDPNLISTLAHGFIINGRHQVKVKAQN